VGAPTKAIAHAMEGLYALEATIRRAAGAVGGWSDGTLWIWELMRIDQLLRHYAQPQWRPDVMDVGSATRGFTTARRQAYSTAAKKAQKTKSTIGTGGGQTAKRTTPRILQLGGSSL
jgi:hypothetical protein